jgi:hypothetical protein
MSMTAGVAWQAGRQGRIIGVWPAALRLYLDLYYRTATEKRKEGQAGGAGREVFESSDAAAGLNVCYSLQS